MQGAQTAHPAKSYNRSDLVAISIDHHDSDNEYHNRPNRLKDAINKSSGLCVSANYNSSYQPNYGYRDQYPAEILAYQATGSKATTKLYYR